MESPYYCSGCGHAWRVSIGALLRRMTPTAVSTVPRCPRCSAVPFFEATCAWCHAMFLHEWGQEESCPSCGHVPYWER